MKNKPNGIFISYRRDGGDGLAGRVRDALRSRGFRVFLDVEDLKTGKFNTALYAEIDRCSDVIIILSPGALDRCFNEGDWVRLEIAYALKSKKNIVPVFGRNFEFPQTPLPEDINELPYYNGLNASHDLFEASMDKVAGMLITTTGKPRKKILAYALCLIGLLALIGVSRQFLFSKRTSGPVATQTAQTPPEDNTGGALEIRQSASAQTDVDKDAIKLSQKDIRVRLAMFTPPRWHLSVDLAPEKREIADIKEYFYSLDGKKFERSPTNAWITIGAAAYEAESVFLKFERWNGATAGPFEYKLDFKGFSLERMKEEITKNPLISGSDPSFHWSYHVIQNLPAIKYIEKSPNADFKESDKLVEPRDVFAEYYFKIESNRDSLDKPALASQTTPVYIRAVFFDDTKGNIQSVEVTPDFVKNPRQASTFAQKKQLIQNTTSNLIEGHLIYVDYPESRPAKTEAGAKTQKLPGPSALSSDELILLQAKEREQSAAAAASAYERNQIKRMAEMRFKTLGYNERLFPKLPQVIFCPNATLPLGPWQAIREIKWGLTETQLDRSTALNPAIPWDEITKSDPLNLSQKTKAENYFNTWNLILPASTKEIYAKVVFTDGSETKTLRYQVTPKNLNY